MIRNIIVASIIWCVSASANAQTWDEWFNQSDKQKEYDQDQLKALAWGWTKVVGTMITTGEGLKTISNILEGNFNLTRDFFGRLNNCNPDIAAGAKVIDMIAFQYYITRDMRRVYAFCASNRNFTAREIRYIETVHANFLVMTDANISELLRIIRPEEVKMNDAERIQNIDVIYEDMLDQRAFVNAFSNDVYALSRERQKEAANISAANRIMIEGN